MQMIKGYKKQLYFTKCWWAIRYEQLQTYRHHYYAIDDMRTSEKEKEKARKRENIKHYEDLFSNIDNNLFN